ncbi:MAG: efflux RND transporter permease subunit [Planctomycetes bacterium]|nr:efflux RND transporter permease subunit [Planctomycetota bacterium]
MFSRYFIDRPIFAAVLSIVITLAGGISVFTLPLAQFPRITPPTVTVQANYPGANAKDVAEAVAAPIEEYINGVEGMMYMSSQCSNDGSYNLTVTFHQGVNLDMAQVLVQNRVSLAIPKLPDVIKATGVITRKRSPDILMGIAILSPNRRYDQLYLSNFALRRIKDELSRVDGVGDVFLFGQRDYSMRIWLDPGKLAYRSMTAADVVAAVREQNSQLASGMIGQPPTSSGQEMQLTLDVLGRLSEVEQFENIIIKTMPPTAMSGGTTRVVRLKDVARIQLGAKSEDVDTNLDGRPTVFLAIFQLPDANALATHDRILEKMKELKRDFPEDVDWEVGFNTTPYTRESIKEVLYALLHSLVLVAAVVLLFLQNWRSAIIPLCAAPVAIIGTFAVMAAFGFSLNNLTLFGLVLAIGIVVDDAIVVVEAVEHHIETGLSPRQATIKAMEQVSGPVVAVALVLSAVFVPCALISGITGLFFKQFALTIAVSTLISAFNSLTLSPALTALLLRPLPTSALSHNGGSKSEAAPPLPRFAFVVIGAGLAFEYLSAWTLRAFSQVVDANSIDLEPARIELAANVTACLLGAAAGWILSRPVNRALAWFFRIFNAGFRGATHGYAWGVGKFLRFSVVALALYGSLVGATYFGFSIIPKGFIPSQDMGYLMVAVQLPDSASMERTQEVMRQADAITRAHPSVRHATTISGQSFALSAIGSNFGSMFVNLKDYSTRREQNATMSPEDRERFVGASANDIVAYLSREFGKIHDAMLVVFAPPPVRGVGRAGGFAFVLEDRGDLGPKKLQEWCTNLTILGNNRRVVAAIVKGYPLDVPTDSDGALDLNRLFANLEELAKEHPDIDAQQYFSSLFSVFRANVPQLETRPDPREITRRFVRVQDAATTLSVFQGSLYINDFNLLGRTWQVIAQADAPFRYRIPDLYQLKTRNSKGDMVPLGALGTVSEVTGPLILNRYNMYPAATLNGATVPGVSSGQAIEIMRQLAKHAKLPREMAYEWTDMSFLELQAEKQRVFGYDLNMTMVLFSLAVIMVFLMLAAQYESWSLPLAVILVVPVCLLSALIGVYIAGQDINIFTQIGFVVLVGLSSKNAILIVEFAKRQREAGVPRYQATLEACKLRLRPIIMTSLAFILGVVPLILSEGAGAEMRRTLGTAVFSGMLGVTLFGIFLTPVFFYIINWMSESAWFNSPAVRWILGVSLMVLGSWRLVPQAVKAVRNRT